MRWLHISDIHYNPEGDGRSTSQLRERLLSYLSGFAPVDKIFITGDFCYAKTQPDTEENAKAVVKWIRDLSSRILKEDDPAHIHIAPGNHDLSRFEAAEDKAEEEKRKAKAKERIAAIRKAYRANDGQFSPADNAYVLGRFSYFQRVCSCLYGKSSIWASGTDFLHPYQYIREFNVYILHINTAIVCGDNDDGNLVIGNDNLYRALDAIKKENKVNAHIIALAHHGLRSFAETECQAVEKLLQGYNVKLYLCGDAHKGWVRKINKTVELTMGCMKEADGTQAVFSFGELKQNGEVTINTHRWDSQMDGWDDYKPFDKRIKEMLPSFPAYRCNPEITVFGRGTLIDEVFSELRPRRAVIAHGLLGIGKSTICRQVLARIPDDKAIEVDLSQLYTVNNALTKISTTLGGNPADTTPLPEQIERLCSTRAGHTLYLDNLEDPLKDEGFKKWFLSFVSSVDLKILCSSRTQLNSPKTIKNIPIPNLSPGDAKNMFCDLWGDDVPGDDLPKLESLLKDLAYHPLSICLVAGQKWRLPTIDKLSKGWHESETREDIRTDDTADRHHSLTAAAYMSYTAIENDREAKILWGVLSFMPGAMSRQVFEIIFAENLKKYERAAETLVKNCLIEWGKDNPPSYVMLAPIKNLIFAFDDSVRSVCAEMICAAFTAVFYATSDRSHPESYSFHHSALAILPSACAFLMRTKLEGENVGLVLMIGNYFQFSVLVSLDVLRSIWDDKTDPLVKAFLFRYMGELSSRLGDIDTAITNFEESEKLYRDYKNTMESANIGFANLLRAFGDLASQKGDIKTAREKYKEAEEIYQKAGNRLGLANVLQTTGDLERRLGDKNIAKEMLEKAENIYREKGVNSDVGLAYTLCVLGYLSLQNKDIDAAKMHCIEAIKLYDSLGTNLGVAHSLRLFGAIDIEQGQIDDAINHYKDALELYKSEQTPRGRIYCMARLCLAYAMKDDITQATEYQNATEKELELAEKLGIADDIKSLLNQAKSLLTPKTAPQ